MKLGEFIEKLNKAYIVQNDSLDRFREDLYGGYQELLDAFEAMKPEKVAEGLDVDKHRWYEVTTDVYKVSVNGLIRYLGIRGASDLFSETMAWEDAYVYLEAIEMQEVKEVTYKAISKVKDEL